MHTDEVREARERSEILSGNRLTAPTERRQLAYILAPSYTGSTLLTFLLSKHQDIATVGELKGTARGDLNTYPCSCGALQRECRFWKQLQEEMDKDGAPLSLEDFGTHFQADSFLPDRLLRAGVRGPFFETARDLMLRRLPGCRRRLEEVVERNRRIIELICTLQGGTTFLDGSKDPIRLKLLAAAGHWDVKVIYLIRDGRGATNSYMRHNGVGMDRAAAEWARTHRECDRMVREPGLAGITIRYEELCRRPEETMAEIYAFLGLDMGRTDDATDHHILGNQMRLNSLAEITLDEKWRRALGPQDLQRFERIAGALNRSYGYVG